MTDMWIHCNNCELKYQLDLIFFVTECGHLYCEHCASRIQNGNNICFVCKSTTQIIRFKYFLEIMDQIKEIYMDQDNIIKSHKKSLMTKDKINLKKSKIKSTLNNVSNIQTNSSANFSFLSSINQVPPSNGNNLITGNQKSLDVPKKKKRNKPKPQIIEEMKSYVEKDTLKKLTNITLRNWLKNHNVHCKIRDKKDVLIGKVKKFFLNDAM